jgi:hypothetical protein
MSDAMDRLQQAIGRLQAYAATFAVLCEVLKRPDVDVGGINACSLICDEIHALQEQAAVACDQATAERRAELGL